MILSTLILSTVPWLYHQFSVLSWTFTQCNFIFILHLSYWIIIIYYCLSNWNEKICKYRIILKKDNPMNEIRNWRYENLQLMGDYQYWILPQQLLPSLCWFFLSSFPIPFHMSAGNPETRNCLICTQYFWQRNIKTAHQKIFTMLKANC